MTLANAVNNVATGLQYLSSNGVFTAIANGTSTQMFSGVTSSTPTYNSYQQVTGLGIGASPGSTTGLTFNGSNFITQYNSGTFTPTQYGSVTAGTPTYTIQQGYYLVLGNLVICTLRVSATVSGGTGDFVVGGLPYSLKNQTYNIPLNDSKVETNTWATGSSQTMMKGIINSTTANITCCGTTINSSNLPFVSNSGTKSMTLIYQI